MPAKAKSKTCKAIQFAKNATNADILAKCKLEWVKRNKMSDGTLNKNNYAPIYVVRGDDEKMSVRRSGKELVLFASVAQIPCPLPTLKW